MGMVPSPPALQDDAMDMSGFMGADSLDDIVRQNQDMYRSQSLGQIFDQGIDQRSSMLEFGSAHSGLNGYQFAPSTLVGNGTDEMRPQTTTDLDLTGYSDMGSRMNMSDAQMAFTSSMQTAGPLAIDTSAFSGMSPAMLQGIMTYSPMGM